MRYKDINNFELKMMYNSIRAEILKRQKSAKYNDLVRLRMNLRKQLVILDRKIEECKF